MCFWQLFDFLSRTNVGECCQGCQCSWHGPFGHWSNDLLVSPCGSKMQERDILVSVHLNPLISRKNFDRLLPSSKCSSFQGSVTEIIFAVTSPSWWGRRSWSTLAWPVKAAWWRGLFPSEPKWFTSTRWSARSRFTVVWHPALAAWCRAVLFDSSTLLTSSPLPTAFAN